MDKLLSTPQTETSIKVGIRNYSEHFLDACDGLITDTASNLSKNSSWGAYLKNMFIKITNVVRNELGMDKTHGFKLIESRSKEAVLTAKHALLEMKQPPEPEDPGKGLSMN